MSKQERMYMVNYHAKQLVKEFGGTARSFGHSFTIAHFAEGDIYPTMWHVNARGELE